MFHFVLRDSGEVRTKPEIIKRRNAFDRFFLRLFGMKTERTIYYRVPVDLPTQVDYSKEPVEVCWYGSMPFVQTRQAFVASR